jgi:hypothetical protein
MRRRQFISLLLRRLGVIANTGSPGATAEMRAFEDTARKLNFVVSVSGIRL